MDPTRHTEQVPSGRPQSRLGQDDGEKAGAAKSEGRQAAEGVEKAGDGKTSGSESIGKVGGDSGDILRMTRDQLYDRARDLSIPGRSVMTKVQLLQAVRMAMASQTSGQH